MNELAMRNVEKSARLTQATIRIRRDQRKWLTDEVAVKGGNIADAVRDNLDLAFAIKSELASIAVGEYDEGGPKNTTKLVHSLLFRVEERLLLAFDELARKIEHTPRATDSNGANIDNVVQKFCDQIVGETQFSKEVWLGAFLEIVPRLNLLGEAQIRELEEKGARRLNG